MIRINPKRGNKFHYSPLRYPGGKTSLFPFFDRVMRENGLEHVTYVEPYAGGAGAALALLLLEKVDRIVINDFDPAIYAFWKSAIFSSERFIASIMSTSVSVKEWRRQRQIYRDPKSKQFELGFATFFLNRTNISGILDGGPIGGLDQHGKWKIDARYNKQGLIERICQLAAYKNRITVCNKDGVKLISEYLGKRNTFVYLDPPYFAKGATLYLNHYQKKDHEALARKLNKKAEACWLLTYDNQREIRDLYPKRQIMGFSLRYNAYEARSGKEIMVVSDALSV